MNDEQFSDKQQRAAELLEQALTRLVKAPKDLVLFAAAAKAFEVTFEYAWKSFKRAADGAGLEVYSPRDAIKAAAQLKLISDPQLWNDFLNARNVSVHDYIGLTSEQFLALLRRFKDELDALA